MMLRQLSTLLASATAMTLAITVAYPSYGNVILLDDNFEDGTFLGASETPNLPDETVMWIGRPAQAVEGIANTARINVISGTSEKAWWNFAENGQYSPLSNGDSLIARIDLTPQLLMSTSDSRNLRIGLFFDPTNEAVQLHTNSDGGGSGNPYQDAVGYAAFLGQNSEENTSAPIDAGKRTLPAASTSLMGSAGAYTKMTGGDSIQWSVGNKYQIEQIVTRVSDLLTTYTVNIHDLGGEHGGGIISTHTVNDNGTSLSVAGQVNPDTGVDKFRFIGWRTSDSESTAFRYDISRVYVEGPALVPEPSTLILALIFAPFAAWRRRR